MPEAQISTSISDLVLAVSVLYFVLNVLFVNFFAAMGLSIQGAAAAVGVARFAMPRVHPQVKQYHQLLSWLAQVVGIPFLGIGFVHDVLPKMVTLNFMFIIVVIVVSRLLDDSNRKLLTEAASGFGMLSVILASLYTLNIYGLIGAGIYVAAGLMVGSEGTFNNIPRIDILHYSLAVGNVFFKWALV